MEYNKKVAEALSYISERVSTTPKAVLVLGSGLGGLADSIKDPIVIPYTEIPHWPLSTAPGHAGRLVFGFLDNVYVAVMQGRMHFYEGYSMKDITFPVRVFGEWGISCYIASNASGGINLAYLPGDMVVLYDHINYMGTNPLIGTVFSEKEERFPDMSYTYDRELLDMAEASARENNLTVRRGVYIAFTGPSYETPAEIRALRILGADAVGMSTVPEVITARHCGMKVLGISCITNMAAGILERKLDHTEVVETAKKVEKTFIQLVTDIISNLRT